MKDFRKLPLALAVTSAVFLAGCLGGGGGGGGSSSGSPVSTTTVEGTAAKGIVLGGIVQAFEFGTNNLLSETTTSEVDGSYQLTLPDSYQGTPILIVVSATDGTLMRCDLLVCRGDGENVIAFGDDYPLAEGFQLRAAVPGTTASTVQANVTALTTAAAAIAEERSAGTTDANDVVLAANAQVANRFGLVGDLTTMKVIDITDETQDASAAESRYSVMSAAIAGALMSAEDGLTPEAALNGFVSRFAEQGLADTGPTDPGSLTLESILAQAAVLAEAAGMTSAKADFQAEAAKAATSGSTTPSQGEVPVDVGSEGLVATKQFVQQVRDLTNTAALEENLRGFADEVEMVSQVAGDDLKASLSATGMALRAIAEAEEARQNGVTETSFDFDGVVVSRAGKVYTVKQVLPVNGLDVNVDITADVTYVNNVVDRDDDDGMGTWQPVFLLQSESTDLADSESGSYSTKGDVEIRIAVSGTASSTNARVTIAEGSLIDAKGSIDVTGTWSDKWSSSESGSESGWEDSEDGSLLLTHLDTLLTVKLEQLATAEITDPMSFTGTLDLDVNNFGLTRSSSEAYSWQDQYFYSEYHSYSEYKEEFREDSELAVDLVGLSLTVSGRFENSANVLSASASLQAEGVGFSQTCYEHYSSEYRSGGYQWFYEDDCSLGEDATGNLKLAINFDLDLVGMSDPINVAINAQNQGMDSVIGEARLAYGGSSLHLDYQGGDRITVQNHNDVVLTLEEKQTSDGDVLTGNIQWKGKEYATVDDELGVPRIRYADGTFEML